MSVSDFKPAPFFISQRANILRIFMFLSKQDKPVTSLAIAQELDISKALVGKLTAYLSKSDLIDTYKGVAGGFILTSEPKDITVLDMIGFTILPEEEPHGLFVLMRRMVDIYDEVTLQDLLDWDE